MSDTHREAGLLVEGDQMFSPAGRWETIKSIDSTDRGVSLIYTDSTGPEYGWRVENFRRVRFIARERSGLRVVKVYESDVAMHVALGEPPSLVWAYDSPILAAATHVRGSGFWTIINWPSGRDQVTTQIKNRGVARAQLRLIAREHAKALGLAYVSGRRALLSDKAIAVLGSRLT